MGRLFSLIILAHLLSASQAHIFLPTERTLSRETERCPPGTFFNPESAKCIPCSVICDSGEDVELCDTLCKDNRKVAPHRIRWVSSKSLSTTGPTRRTKRIVKSTISVAYNKGLKTLASTVKRDLASTPLSPESEGRTLKKTVATDHRTSPPGVKALESSAFQIKTSALAFSVAACLAVIALSISVGFIIRKKNRVGRVLPRRKRKVHFGSETNSSNKFDGAVPVEVKMYNPSDPASLIFSNHEDALHSQQTADKDCDESLEMSQGPGHVTLT